MKRLFVLLCCLAIAVPGISGTVENASRWGFDKNDATECLQKAIDSGAAAIRIDNTGHDWVIRPVKLRSDLELIVGENVKVKAHPEHFLGVNDVLLRGDKLKNITIRGEKGAVLEMNRRDYADKSRYAPSEWRHCIALYSSENIVIRDLTIRGSGGDGIYLGSLGKPMNYCKDIVIENVVADDHHRQGLSVISAENLLVRNCTFSNTKGTLPMSGIDFEPNYPEERLVNCVVENCTFTGNDGSGADIYILKYNEQSPPMSIAFRDCVFDGNNRGIFLEAGKSRGRVEYINCRVTGSRKHTAYFHIPGKGLEVSFDGCSFDNSIPVPAFLILANRPSGDIGKILFNNTLITDLISDAVALELRRSRIGTDFAEAAGGTVTFNGRPYQTAELLQNEKAVDELLKKHPVAEAAGFELERPQAAVPARTPALLRFRGVFSTVFLAGEGEVVKVALTGSSMWNKASKTRISYQVAAPDGNIIKKDSFPADTNVFNLEFTAETAGLYTLTVNTNRQQVQVAGSHRGQAMRMDNGVLGLVKARGKLYFEVPAGVTEFHIAVSTDPGELVTASLVEPGGKKVQTHKGIDGMRIFSGKSDGTGGSIWALDFESAVEDIYVHFLSPLSPYCSPSRDLLLRLR